MYLIAHAAPTRDIFYVIF